MRVAHRRYAGGAPSSSQEIIKNTPATSPDLPQLQSAHELIESVLAGINEQTKILEESQRILAIQSKIESGEVR